ncbi:uncharacterized protein ACR2FA_007763 [Aphomia sociella]
MDHIRQFDWCSSRPDFQFIAEEEVDNCVTERILRNKFRDPLITSDSDDEQSQLTFDWDQIFKRGNDHRQFRMYVAGLRSPAPYPKLSSLTAQQHYQCLKVLCSRNPTVLKEQFIPRPNKHDHNVFQEVREIYEKEQKEYLEWAKTLWTNNHCSRALRPKPPIEMVYEAEFKIKAHELQSLPKDYELVAQIPLETKNHKCNIIFEKDLKSVDISELPLLDYTQLLHKKINVLAPCPVPEPCNKHPCRFILPNEQCASVLPRAEVCAQAAAWGAARGGAAGAARRTAPPRRQRRLAGRAGDGEPCNVIVLGNDFTTSREPAQTRTYKALRHLVEYALIPLKNKKPVSENRVSNDAEVSNKSNDMASLLDDLEMSSEDEGDNLYIAEPEFDSKSNHSETDTELKENRNSIGNDKEIENENNNENSDGCNENMSNGGNISCNGNKENRESIGFYNCTCKDTDFDRLYSRSFKKWRIRNETTNETQDIIVHTSHKVRGETGELVIEPIPEYQIELGGSRQSHDKIRSLALSLLLHRNASLLNVRVDAPTGEIVTMDNVTLDELTKDNDVLSEAANRIYTLLNQLQGLMPGHYILEHEPEHGANALLYAARRTGRPSALSLQFAASLPADARESLAVRAAPLLSPALLPYHKFRKILPCAFTPHLQQVARDTKRPPARQRTPPQALKLDEQEQRAAGRKVSPSVCITLLAPK